MNNELLVKSLGMSEKEARVYLAILGLGSSTIQPIANRSGVKRTSIYYFIDHLVVLGLVDKSKVGGRLRYTALSPSRLVELQQQRLRQVEQTLPEFLSLFNISAKKPKISYFEGPEQMKNIILEEARCKTEAWYIWRGRDVMDMIGGPKFMAEVDRKRKAKGVRIRTIRFHEADITFKGSGNGPEELRKLRWAPTGVDFPMIMGIYDTEKVGFLTSRKSGFGILIESPEFVQAMRVLFQSFWQQSTPAKDGEG